MNELRKIRHDIRGCLHGMQLCISALQTPVTKHEAVEFLEDVEKSADKMLVLIDKFEMIVSEQMPAQV